MCEDAAGLRASSWAKPVTWRRRRFAFWGVVPTISAAAMMRRDYAWRSKETRRCRRPDEGVGIEPWNLQQTNSLPVCPGHTNRLPKKSLQRFPIPKPPVGCGRMPACLSPLVFEIGDRCRRGSDPEQPKDKDAVWESLCEERAQNGLCGAGRDRRPVLRSGVKANRINLALRPPLSPKPG